MVDLESLDSLPVSALVRIGGCGLKDEGGATIGQGSIHHIAVTSDPAYVSYTAKQLTLVVVKCMFMGDCCIQEVSSTAVAQSLYRNFQF